MSDLKVLNVDDEPQARRAVKLALIARGFEVLEAACGEDASSSATSTCREIRRFAKRRRFLLLPSRPRERSR